MNPGDLHVMLCILRTVENDNDDKDISLSNVFEPTRDDGNAYLGKEHAVALLTSSRGRQKISENIFEVYFLGHSPGGAFYTENTKCLCLEFYFDCDHRWRDGMLFKKIFF